MANAIVSEKRIIVKLIDEFTNKYKIVSSSMQDLTKQIEAFNNKLKVGTSSQQLKQEMDTSQKAIKDTTEKVKDLGKEIEKPKKTKIDNSNADKQLKDLENHIKNFQKPKLDFKGFTFEISDADKKLKRLEDHVKNFHQPKLEFKSFTFDRQIKELNSKTNSFNSTLQKVIGSLGKLKSNATNTFSNMKKSMDETKEKASRLGDIIKGSLVAQGISGAISGTWNLIKTGIGGAIAEGLKYNRLQQNMKAQWTTLAGSAKEGQKLVDMTNELAIAAQNSTEMVNGLNQQYYSVTENADKTKELTKATLTLQDAFGKSDAEVQNFSLQFSQMMANGKASAQDFLSFTNVFPKMKGELVKYEQEVKHNTSLTTKDINEMISNGEISAEDMFNVMMRMQDKYKDATKNFGSTLDGMARTIKGTMPRLLGSMTQGMANQANPIFQQVSSWVSDKKTEKKFEELGKTISKGTSSVMEAIQKSIGAKDMSDLLDKMMDGITNGVEKIADFLSEHADDLITGAKAIWDIVKALGEGVWSSFSTFLSILGGGDVGDSTKTVADSLKEISKHKDTIETIGKLWATYWIASKFFKVAQGIYSIADAIQMIGTGKSLKDLGGLSGLFKKIPKKIEIKPTVKEGGILGKFKSLGSRAASSFSKPFKSIGSKLGTTKLGSKIVNIFGNSGDKAGTKFFDKLLTKIGGEKLAGLGKGIGGKLAAGVGVAFSAFDLFKGITQKKDRAINLGKGIGGLFGAGFGFAVGGPVGASIGNMLGSAVVGGVVKHWKGLKTEMGKIMHGDWSGVWSDAKKGFSNMVDGLKDTWGKTKNFFSGNGFKTDKEIKNSKSKAKKKQKEDVVPDFEAPVTKKQSKAQIGYIKDVEAALNELKNKIKKAGLGKAMTGQMNSLKKAVKNTKLSSSFTSLKKQIENVTKSFNNSKIAKKFGSTLKELKTQINKNNPSKELNKIGKEFKNSAKAVSEVDKPVNKLTRTLKSLDKQLKTFKKVNPFGTLNKDIKTFDSTLKKVSFGKELSKQMDIANKAMGKNGFVGDFSSMVNSVIKSLKSFKRSFNSNWKTVWSKARPTMNNYLDDLPGAFSKRTNKILDKQEDFESSFNKSWRGWLNYISNKFKSTFDELPSKAHASMSKIISEINKGINSLNSVISAFGGTSLKTASYATGTPNVAGTHPGGLMTVNDDGSADPREIIMRPNGDMFMMNGRNLTIWGEPGTTVFNSTQSKFISKMMNVPKYADGTDSSSDMLDYIMEHAEEISKNPFPFLNKQWKKAVNFTHGSEFYQKFGNALGSGFLKAIQNPFKKMVEESDVAAPAGSGVERWRPQVIRALKMLGLSTSLVGKVLKQIQTESGGNEKVTQQGADPDGDGSGPAIGLMQTKRGTFNQYALAGHHNIFNGFDNILAGLNYAKSRYGSSLYFLGQGHGYANGGEITQKELAWIGDNAQQHEFVINPYSASSIPLTNKLIDTMSNVRPELKKSGTTSNLDKVINILYTIADNVKNIDLQPVVNIDENAKAINKYNAKNLMLRRG